MKLVSLTIIAFISINDLKAQTLQTTTDSTVKHVTAFPYTDLLPPDFIVPSPENEYYSDSSSISKDEQDLVFKLKLRNNCTFVYEAYYKSDHRTRIVFAIGTYTIANSLIHLIYRPMLSADPNKIYISPTTPVERALPKEPEYLLVKKSLLVESNKKGRAMKTIYIQTDKLQFDVGTCK
ncbi:MAG: hypothetical protein IT236_09685 [Bacteroidia bacterium]|nr:hypothetical protein [Bacteroidia bacterium]